MLLKFVSYHHLCRKASSVVINYACYSAVFIEQGDKYTDRLQLCEILESSSWKSVPFCYTVSSRVREVRIIMWPPRVGIGPTKYILPSNFCVEIRFGERVRKQKYNITALMEAVQTLAIYWRIFEVKMHRLKSLFSDIKHPEGTARGDRLIGKSSLKNMLLYFFYSL